MPYRGFELKSTLVAAFCVLLAGCATTDPARSGMVSPQVSVWLTTQDRASLLAEQPPLTLAAHGAPEIAIEVDPAQRYQTMVGFGAAVTDASAALIQHALTPEQRTALLRDLFGPAPGIRLGFTRVTIGASDFSQSHYSYDDMPEGETDPTLRRFSIAPARRDVLPTVRAALAINPDWP